MLLLFEIGSLAIDIIDMERVEAYMLEVFKKNLISTSLNCMESK